MAKSMNKNVTALFSFFLLSALSLTVTSAEENPPQIRDFIGRYWYKHITNNHSIPHFILNKASPLSVPNSYCFANLASQNALSPNLSTFCSDAHLFCDFKSLPNEPLTHKKNDTMIYGGCRDGEPDYEWVEGKYFRESMLQEGNIMKMPNFHDTLPKRSFLPRIVSSKIPFSISEFSNIKNIFHVTDNSVMEKEMMNTLEECEVAPSEGEFKKCVESIEDMIDFSIHALGRNLIVSTTRNSQGSMEEVMIGKVKQINGEETAVSCHQSFYPYLTYYCHCTPKVRVYEVDIHDKLQVNEKMMVNNKINRVVAICHVDTSAWNPNHRAFVEIGSGPGRIEVCHWTLHNEMTWTPAA